MARIMGGQVGQAFTVTLVRVRSQIASNHIGLHLQRGDWQVAHRLQTYAAVTGRAVDPVTASDRAAAVLGGVVRSAATTQGVIDGFVVIGGLTALCLMIVAARRAAPVGPASHMSLFAPRGSPPQAAGPSPAASS
jgi:MFS transporter, DHA2 family, multidrug resistance protein